MISESEILALGFTKVDAWSTDIVDSYSYIVNRYDKPRNTINVYRLDRLIDTDYFELKSSLQRETDFFWKVFGFNGELETVDDLFDVFELAKEQSRKQ